MFFRRKRAKAGDDDILQPAGQGQEEGSRGGGRPRRLATARAPVETDSSYEESDSEGAYQPAAHETAEASQETGFVEEDEDDEEESSSPGERPLPGGRNVANIPVNEWTQPEYWAFREQDPYVAATELGADPRFRNVFQARIFNELMMAKSKKFAPHKQINVEHLRDNAHIYPGVYDALGRLGLIPFCQFSYKYNEDLVMQFYATVYFMNDDARTMRWMSGTAVCSAPFSKFAEIIPYQFYTVPHPDFERVSETGRDKDEIAFAYKQEKSFVTGSIKDLLPTYDTLRHILRMVKDRRRVTLIICAPRCLISF